MDTLLADRFFERFRIVCVPMVDFDGVTEGDQGKARAPYDHNRDYRSDLLARYSATREIRKIAASGKLRFAFDFHSPWHLGGENDTLFIPINSFSSVDSIATFSALFEAENRADALPHYAKDDVLPDVRWNKFGTPSFGFYMGTLGAELSFTLETPYFKVGNTVFSPEKAYESGKNFVAALKNYIQRK